MEMPVPPSGVLSMLPKPTASVTFKFPPDVVHEILSVLSDYTTLSAAIRVSKAFYDAFQSRSWLIVHSILEKIVGPALPQAKRLEYYEQWVVPTGDPRRHTIPDEEYFRLHASDWEPTKASVSRMVERAKAVQLLEGYYSIRFKDRTSCSSRLDAIEAVRFEKALYRYWLCYELLKNDAFTWAAAQPPFSDLSDVDDVMQEYAEDPSERPLYGHSKRIRNGFVNVFRYLASQELLELLETLAFLEDSMIWLQNAHWEWNVPFAPTSRTPIDPAQLARSLEARLPQDEYGFGSDEHNLIWVAARAVLRQRKDPAQFRAYWDVKAIIIAATDNEAQCSRCQTIAGDTHWGLLGPPNMFLLEGMLSREEKIALLPAAIATNANELRLLHAYTKYPQCRITLDKVIFEMMDMGLEEEDEQENMWKKDGWYCLGCIEDLYRRRIEFWWQDRKMRCDIHV
ncbi:hypothetical protein GY45DRAFT_1324790 [Cubamyces sp. BRFM 1775]|nr:hypothetical protein GY45DRAFT_1324790 [Cubamyces sp. BRFM 1775]